jgi:PAS domain-containing protein
VFDIFGLPRCLKINRNEAVTLYREESRAKMERLRAYAIKQRRGFTIDVELRPATGGNRWMRLIAAPVCDGTKVVRLHGLKLMI